MGFANALMEAVALQPGELEERGLPSSMAHWGVLIDGKVRQLRNQGHSMLEKASEIEKAWKKWDADELVSLDVLSRFQGQQLKAVLASQK